MPERARRPEAGRVRQDNVNRITGEVEESRTKQEMGAACDINNIMRKYEKTGEIDHMSLKPPKYGDFTSTMSFQEARNNVIAATQAFEKLPHEIRTFFENDPANMVDFMSDDKNIEVGKQLGLYVDDAAPENQAPVPEPVVETPEPPPAPVAPEESDT